MRHIFQNHDQKTTKEYRDLIRMIQQHLTEQDIAKAAEAIASDRYSTLDKRIRTHLVACDDCANEVQMVQMLEHILKKNSKSRAPQSKRQGIDIRLIIGIAASAAIIIGSIHFLQKPDIKTPILVENTAIEDSIETRLKEKMDVSQEHLSKSQEEQTTEVETVPIEKAKADQDQLAYQSHQELEALVKRFEEGNMRGEGLKVISSSTIEEEADFVTLCWENPSNEGVIIEFFSNKGDKLYETYSEGNSHHPEKLPQPGLYYWKMLNADFDLIFCGRIMVR